MTEVPFDPDEWKSFDPNSQKAILAAIESAKKEKRLWYCTRGRSCDGLPHDDITYNHARGDQWPPSDADWFVWLIKSGRGCVAPWTRIYDPVSGQHRRVDEMAETFVQTLRGPRRTDGAPFVKGLAHMWTLTTSRGDQVTVTDEHRFLTPQGWQRLDSLRVGQQVAAAPHAHRPAASASPSASRGDVRSSHRTPGGSQADYQKCRHCGDPQLLMAATDAQAGLPSQGDAGAHSQLQLRQGGRESSAKCSHAYLPSSHLPRSSSSLGGPLVAADQFPGSPSLGVLSPDASPESGQSRMLTYPGRAAVAAHYRCTRIVSLDASSQHEPGRGLQLVPTPGGDASVLIGESPSALTLHERSGLHREDGRLHQDRSSSDSDDPDLLLPLVASFVEIESIEYSHYGEYYDLTVPSGQHYTAEGMIHHNSGKTRSGAEWVRSITKKVGRIALVGRRGPDVRGTMVEGESGLINVCERAGVPYEWFPSRKEFHFGNGAKAFGYSGEEPDTMRGPQYGAAWLDEPAHMPLIEDVWDNLIMGLRLPGLPGGAKALCTSTPLPLAWLKKLQKDERTRTVTVSTYKNLMNLDQTFKRNVLEKYEGTRLGRQELYGEVLEDVEGALWSYTIIEPYRNLPGEDFIHPEDMDRIVVGVDPAGSSSKKRDETGIIVIGRRGDHYYVIDDFSGHYTPNGWARAAWQAYDKYNADCVVAEKNYGGEMVLSTLRNVRNDGNAKLVYSRRGKVLRAEPVVGLYEQGRVHHFEGLDDLETQQTEWIADQQDSPDRVDALVHGATELSAGRGGPASIAVPGSSMNRDEPKEHSRTPFSMPLGSPSQLLDHRGIPFNARSW